MYTLLAICLVLHPMCVDESIQQALREKNFHEKMYKMQYGDLQVGWVIIIVTKTYFITSFRNLSNALLLAAPNSCVPAQDRL
jgi:hypothetical protein